MKSALYLRRGVALVTFREVDGVKKMIQELGIAAELAYKLPRETKKLYSAIDFGMITTIRKQATKASKAVQREQHGVNQVYLCRIPQDYAKQQKKAARQSSGPVARDSYATRKSSKTDLPPPIQKRDGSGSAETDSVYHSVSK